jgi:hypothetical protein
MVQVDNKRLLLLGGFQKESDSSPVQEALIFHLGSLSFSKLDFAAAEALMLIRNR